MSQVVNDYLKDFEDNIPELFKDSPIYYNLLLAILSVIVSQKENIVNLSDSFFDIDKAKNYQLDYIGNFLGQERVLTNFSTDIYFGFEGSYQSDTLGTLKDPEVGGVFFSSNTYNPSNSKILTDEQYRRVLKARSIKKNSFNCCIDDFLEVVSLLTDTTNIRYELAEHGHVRLKVFDKEGLLAYFMSKKDTSQCILPLPLGVRLDISE